MPTPNELFSAFADPTRRAIFARLSAAFFDEIDNRYREPFEGMSNA